MTLAVRPLFAGQRAVDSQGLPTPDLLEVIQRLTKRIEELETAVLSSSIRSIVVLADQAAYDALPVKDPNTLYLWS